ncbi:MAG: sugar ABC transporter ATP-binding protein [Proteobacteria bacterium]|nr:sugar ABC transporter ATP-binding protein [Pseudomonadota bacterium]
MSGRELAKEPTPALRAHKLSKRFPGVVALDEVSFELHEAEVHALCGENGAGKSTLIKVLSGIHPHGSYWGEVELWGEPVAFKSIRDAEEAGLSVICQELALVEDMSAAENIFLGREPLAARWARSWGLIDWKRMELEARALLERFGIDLDPGARVGDLGVGRQQLVEIAKALAKQARLLILDEPTAALTDHEVEILLEILRDLRRRGIPSIYISHKLDEVFALADRITVLRDGKSIATRRTQDTSISEVIRDMVGRPLEDVFSKRERHPGEERLRVRGLQVAEQPHAKARLRDISFEVRAGEVLGIGGLMGAGRSELLLHLFGAWGSCQAGRIELDGKSLQGHTPAESIRRGLVLVSEDRKRHGLVLGQSVAFNMSLSSLGSFVQRGLIAQTREHLTERQYVESLGIKTRDLDTTVGTLSGGNQQKVVLGKALMTEPKVVLLDEPSRGIDIGAKLELYELIQQLAERGVAVVLVSSELPELLGLSDRILMLAQGRIGGRFDRTEASQEALLSAAMGHSEDGTNR